MAHSRALCGPRASRGSDQRHGQFALILQAAPDPCVGPLVDLARELEFNVTFL